MSTPQNTYYYGEAGAEVHGPLPLETIRAAMSAGRLSAGVMIGETQAGPWAPFNVVEKLGHESFGKPAKAKPAAAPTAAATAPASRSGCAGYFEAIGWLLIVLGGFCAAFMFGQNPERIVWFAFAAASNFISGLFLIGFGELLERLAQILAELRRGNAGH